MDELKIANTGFTEVYRPENGEPIIEFILVHGLQGHPYRTWAYAATSPPATSTPATSPPDTSPPTTSPPTERRRLRDFFRSSQRSSSVVASDMQSLEAVMQKGKSSDQTGKENSGKVFWPADLLPAICPQARISVYGYESRIAGYQRVDKSHIYQIGKDFLYQLEFHRASHLPIVFIGHSLGGIVLKEALILSADSREQNLRDIIASTAAIVFMGTPHRGSKEWASSGQKARKFARALLMNDNPSLLRTLGLENGDLFRSNDKFTQIWEEFGFNVKTYQEGHAFADFGFGLLASKVVPDESSLLLNPKEHAVSLAANHMEMCRFKDTDDENWRKVEPQLRHYYNDTLNAQKVRSEADDADALRDLFASLTGTGLNDAEYTIALPLDATCQWIFQTPEFISWYDYGANPKFLLVLGKVGSGKSTLMRYLARTLRNERKRIDYNVLSLFLQPSQDGPHTKSYLYRSLLVQILRIPSFRDEALELARRRRSKFLLHQTSDWHQRELEEAFADLFQKPRPDRTFILVDGVDDKDPEQIAHSLFNVTSAASSTDLKICLSLPRNTMTAESDCAHLFMEKHNQTDIVVYVHQKLQFNEALTQDQYLFLETEILEKASGVFLWVTLVVESLREYLADGRDFNFLKSALDKTPNRLFQLYYKMLTRSMDHKLFRAHVTVHVLQWIFFSARPLTIGEWHHVLGFVHNPLQKSLEEWRNSEAYTESDKLLLQRIQRICCGFVEIKDGAQGSKHLGGSDSYENSLIVGAGTFESQVHLEPIHRSVRDFFVRDGGFQLLDLTCKNPRGEGHLYLLEICMRYYFLPEMKGIKVQNSNQSLRKYGSERSASKTPSTSSKPKQSKQLMLPYRGRSLASIWSTGSSGGSMDIDSPRGSMGVGSPRGSMGVGSSAGSYTSRKRAARPRVVSKPRVTAKPKSHVIRNQRNAWEKLMNMSSNIDDEYHKQRIIHYFDSLDTDNSPLGNDYTWPTLDKIASRSSSLSHRNYNTSQNYSESEYPHLWQYSYNMMALHASAADKEDCSPHAIINLLLNPEQLIGKQMASIKVIHKYEAEYFASRWNLVTWLQYLRSSGGYIQPPTKKTLVMAARFENLEALSYLIQWCKEVGFAWYDGTLRSSTNLFPILHYAAMASNSGILDLVTESWDTARSSLNVNATNSQGRAPLHFAALFGTSESVRRLLRLGADCQLCDRAGNTALHLACDRKIVNMAICEALVDAGCRLEMCNDKGLTAAEIANLRRHYYVESFLHRVEMKYSPPKKKSEKFKMKTFKMLGIGIG